MSTLFDEAIEKFEPSNSELLIFAEANETSKSTDVSSPVPVENIGEFPIRRGKTHPERDD